MPAKIEATITFCSFIKQKKKTIGIVLWDTKCYAIILMQKICILKVCCRNSMSSVIACYSEHIRCVWANLIPVHLTNFRHTEESWEMSQSGPQPRYEERTEWKHSICMNQPHSCPQRDLQTQREAGSYSIKVLLTINNTTKHTSAFFPYNYL